MKEFQQFFRHALAVHVIKFIKLHIGNELGAKGMEVVLEPFTLGARSDNLLYETLLSTPRQRRKGIGLRHVVNRLGRQVLNKSSQDNPTKASSLFLAVVRFFFVLHPGTAGVVHFFFFRGFFRRRCLNYHRLGVVFGLGVTVGDIFTLGFRGGVTLDIFVKIIHGRVARGSVFRFLGHCLFGFEASLLSRGRR